MRLIEVFVKGVGRRHLTNVLDPSLINAAEVAQLYTYRWSIETAFR